jgi:hypothetical protein
MIDIVKQLFENDVISEEMKSEIESAWQSKIQENRDQVTAELREEFAQKYEHDKSTMVEAVDKMVSDRLATELSELAEDRNQLIEAKAKYAKKMEKDTKKMEGFVLQKLASELSELHEDRKNVATNFAKLESFIVDALSKEIAEFHADKKDLAETKVKLVRESKAKFEQVKSDFIAKSAKLVEGVVKSKLNSEIGQLKEDIESARRNDFGRRIFESFASEYASSHLNEKSETAKLLKLVKQKEEELAEASKSIQEKEAIVESKDREIRIAKDMASRKEIMSELLNPLTGEKRTVMSELLESVQTSKLTSAFEKYLPAVMAGDAPKSKATLVEGKEVTGDKPQANTNSSEDKTAAIYDIRKLAGLKV